MIVRSLSANTDGGARMNLWTAIERGLKIIDNLVKLNRLSVC